MNSKGFTLIEGLLALLLTSFTLFLISLSVQQINQLMLLTQREGNYEWHVFLHQLEVDRQAEDLIDVQPTYFAFMGETSSGIQALKYEIYRNETGTMIRRRPQSGGHIPMLMNLKSAHIAEYPDYIILQVTYPTGETYSSRIEKEYQKNET